MIDLIITGTGRSGTGYISKLLNSLGIKCGHEEVFTPHGPKYDSKFVADASWLALPHLDAARYIFLQVRHPYDVVASLIGIGFFNQQINHGAFRQFAYSFFDPTDDELIDAAKWWVQCNEMALERADVYWKLEDLSPSILHEALSIMNLVVPVHQIEESMDKLSKDTNHRSRAELSNGDKLKINDTIAELSDFFEYSLDN